MFILNTILAISVVIISAVKTSELFIQSDHALNDLQAKFIKETKELHKFHKNNQGSISLVAAILTSLLSALLLFYLLKMKTEYKEALYRKDSYLCFQYLNKTTERYIREMADFNLALRTAFVIQNSGLATAEAASVFQALTITRNFRHLVYLKKLSLNQYCKFEEGLSYLIKTPFKTKLSMTLTTNIDETSIVENKSWTYFYYKKPEGIRWRKSFCLKADVSIGGAFFPNPKITTHQIATADLSSLKCFSGPS